ncbi:MAG: EamA family transporter [Eubacteriales bacterium]|nr:EamA family transporter [Eubacteriales bacterium]
MQTLWPILVVIAANTVYNICAKQTPEGLNAFASLSVTYFVAMVISLGLFFVTATDKNIGHELTKISWTSFLFGLSVIGLEFGYLNIYRVGWKVSVASLVANIALAVILLLVGLLLYRETISLRQVIGMAVCVVGLVLIGK